MEAASLLCNWNPHPVSSINVTIEDDTLRDGLQGALTRLPDLAQKKSLLTLGSDVGIQYAMLGFPAASMDAYSDGLELARHIRDHGLKQTPRFLARAIKQDLEPIVRIQEALGIPIHADFFINCCRLRHHIEGWTTDSLIRQLDRAASYLESNAVDFSISLEDVTRAQPDDLQKIIQAVSENKPIAVVLCDTAGDTHPAGARRLTEFVMSALHGRGSSIPVWWHGHNDRGMALASAEAAVSGGARCISGSFLGIGERCGNVALEQVALLLNTFYGGEYDLLATREYCDELKSALQLPIASTSPIVGPQAFATSTGTHVAALLKARPFGREFEDLIFSSVRAEVYGRDQSILIGPLAGRSAASFALREAGAPETDILITQLLDHAKTLQMPMGVSQVRQWLQSI